MMFVPPRMPNPLVQELYWPDKWKVLVCCMFLNCTQRKQAEPVAAEFFRRWPSPEAFLTAEREQVAEVIKSLGFKNRRTDRLIRFTKEFLTAEWTDPRVLHGVGEYAARCYEILFLGQFGDSPPDDHALKDYWAWYKANHG